MHRVKFTFLGSYGWKWDRYDGNAKQYYSPVANGALDIRLEPFYLLYGGYILSGSLNNIGSFGDYWSFTANSSASTYSLNFNLPRVFASHNYGHYYGFSIRCLAR